MLDGNAKILYTGGCKGIPGFFQGKEILYFLLGFHNHSHIINKFRNTKAMIRYSTNDQVSAIQGREQALKRAVTNIISNAFAYGKNIAVGLESNNNKLEITVDDDGPGIPADKREDVFKAFYRLDESRNKETGGVGLGLSIARDIITSHCGKIELTDSEL